MAHDSSDKYASTPSYDEPRMQRAQWEAKMTTHVRTLKETTRSHDHRIAAVEKKFQHVSSDMASVTQLLKGYDGNGGMLQEVRDTKLAVELTNKHLERASTQAKTLVGILVVAFAVVEIVVKLI